LNRPFHIRLSTLNSEAAFSVIVVSIGLSCFVWQSMTTIAMFYHARKPIIGIALAQAVLGVIICIITLMTSLIAMDCFFRLFISVIGVNLADMTLLFVLLWKAYLGNNRSKIILFLGLLPILGIGVFICANLTISKSETEYGNGICLTHYPTNIVIIKAVVDCVANTFLSGCFIMVIHKHYPKNVLGGSTSVLYTIDWYLASYLVIKQLQHRSDRTVKEDEEEGPDDDISISISMRQLEADNNQKDEMYSSFSYPHKSDISTSSNHKPKLSDQS
ncbi:hypothetical protein BDB01DRAFT_730874, partial [Pilobolus umbonatus]